ncbi:hypothetical protein [Oceanobacillus sp. Castelsardo]|uniref:hypothetical protein n=1 Tax=Oceanobacillus sp. Castelsardo TaxID=1851204 RepID=UPI0008391D9C|nr:hypothetical protein [Oceanobacillus sp. Castelsardo]
MNKEDKDRQIIENYQENEKMMILVFAQWCINHDLKPEQLYEEAYPNQIQNKILLEVLENTVPKNESEKIEDQMVIQALQLFGNDDLAFIVQKEIEKRERE